MSNIIDKLSDLNAEMDVLGSVMLCPDFAVEYVNRLCADDFYDRRHAIVWTAMQKQIAACEPCEPTSLNPLCGPSVGMDYLFELLGRNGSYLALPHHIARLEKVAAVRRGYGKLAVLQAQALQMDAADWLDLAESFRLAPSRPSTAEDGQTFAELAQQFLANWDKPEAATQRTRTGIRWLDAFYNGGLVVGTHAIVARPGCGKTALATQMAVGVASQNTGCVLFFCVEMKNLPQFDRIVAQDGFDLTGVERRCLPVDEIPRLTNTVAQLGQLDARAFHYSRMTVEKITAKCRSVMRTSKVAAVFIDYYQRIEAQRRTGDPVIDLTYVSMELANLAIDLDAPIVVMAQSKREAEGRMPRLGDISDCSQLEKDAQSVMYPFPVEKMMDGADPGEALMVMKKHRWGDVGVTGPGKVRWDGPRVRYVAGIGG